MAPDHVLVIVSVDPEASHRANEAIRIALGIIAGENDVTIALLGAAVKILDPDVEEYVDGEDIAKHVATLRKLGQSFYVERDAGPAARQAAPDGLALVPFTRDELPGLIAKSNRVLVF